jgi:hypothetical protein
MEEVHGFVDGGQCLDLGGDEHPAQGTRRWVATMIAETVS